MLYLNNTEAVSYTHLDVYKRQGYCTLENMFLTVRGDDGSGGSNAVTFAMTNSGNTAEEKITCKFAVPANEWTHIAVTLQGSVGIM